MIESWKTDPVNVVEQAHERGYRWLALQAEELASTPVDAVRRACHDRGMRCGVWEAAVDYGSPARVAAGFDFWIGQVEGPSQYDRVVNSLAGFRAAFPDLPAATVTNFGGLDTAELARPLIDAGLACIVESHVKEDGTSPDSRIDYAERVLGWPAPQAMVGLGNGATLADYPTFNPGRGDSVFVLEALL